MKLGTETDGRHHGRGARLVWIIVVVAVAAAAVAVAVRWRRESATQIIAGGVSPQLLAEARRAWETGNYAEVVNSLRAVPDDDPFAAEARFLQGRSLWKLNRWHAAENLWKRALELDPRVPQAGWHLLRFYYVEHRWREAEELALTLYDAEPEPRDQTLLLLELIRIEHERLTPAETALMLEPVIAVEPENYHARRTVGFSYVQLKRVTEGLALIEQATKLAPAASDNWFALAVCLDLTGNLQRLGELWPEIPQAVRREPRMLRMRGLWAESAGDFAEAESTYRRVLDADPVHGKAHYELARVLRRRGAEREAAEHERISKQIDVARDRMGTCYAEATRQNDDPPVELCHELSQLCRTLNRPRQAELWLHEATRRASAASRPASAIRKVDSTGPAQRTRPMPSAAKQIEQVPPPTSVPIGRAVAGRAQPQFVDVAAAHEIEFRYTRGETGDFWLPETMGGGVGWLDFDGDGRLDLYFVQGRQLPEDHSGQFAAVLYRNTGHGSWQIVPRAAAPSNTGYGMGVAVGDVDNDGFDDIHVTNYGPNAFYRNNGDGTFREFTGAARLGCDLWSTSAAFADLDQDGDLDLHVANYVDFDPQIRCEDPYTHKQKYCGPDYYTAQNDVLFENLGDGQFRDVSREAGIVVPDGKGLGVVIADLVDDDGRPDIFVANDLRPNFLFRNRGSRSANGASEAATRMSFDEVALKSGVAVNGEGVREANMGIACGDFDGNGHLDLYVTHYFMEHDTFWQNLGSAGFIDFTKPAGLLLPTLQQLSWGTNAIDYDGDGWLDLFVTSGHINDNTGGMVPYAMRPQLFHNERAGGRLRFSDVTADAGGYFARQYVGRGSAVADYDADGDPDIAVTHHHQPASLLRNDTASTGHAIGFRLTGKHSNRSAIGARITVVISESAGEERRIMREIVGGGSYLSADAKEILIGLGTAERVSAVELRWPSGLSVRYDGLAAGGYYTIREAESAARFEPFRRNLP